jgi:hypothetical protein
MDFDQAVVAHIAWKQKLTTYLEKRDGSLNAREAVLDNKCPLGQWIHGEGSSKCSKFPEFSTLKTEHARGGLTVLGGIAIRSEGQSMILVSLWAMH